MQPSRFLVLTGHLNDYPLSDLVGILRHQHKTGRLLIEYPNGPASFFFNDGELVDAQLDKLSGLQALCVALAQPASSFNFNPLIRPTRQSIESSAQRVVSELLGCWSENDMEVEELRPARPAPAALPSVAASSSVDDLVTKTDESLMVSSFTLPPRANSYSHLILGMAAAGLLMLGISTVIAVSGGFGTRLAPAQAATELDSLTDTNPTQHGSGELTQPRPDIEDRADSRGRRQAGKGKEVVRASQLSAPEENKDSSSDSKKTVGSEGDPVPLTVEPKSEVEKTQASDASETQSVRVVLQIESGRVAKAAIANRRPGMEAYEAMALRIARQRRYPAGETTQETVTIKVSQPR